MILVCTDGNVVWQKDLNDEYSDIQTDPCDVRRIILSSTSGVFSSVFMQSLKGDKVTCTRFQAEISEGSSLQCWMPGVHNIVILLLSREIVFFDVEFGVSVGSVRLSSSKPNFDKVIGGFGHETAGKHLYSRGLDVILCHHTDQSISTWKRDGQSLDYTLIRHCNLVESRYSTLSSKGSSVGDVGGKLSFEFLAAVAGPRASQSSDIVDFTKRPWYPSNIYIVGLSLDGCLWKWDLRASSETPCLKSLHEGLSSRVASMSVTKGEQKICGKTSVCFVAIGTVEGALEIHMLRKSRGKLFSLCKLKKLQLTASSSPILGVAWLGTSGKIAAYISQKEGSSGAEKVAMHRNIVKIVDVHHGTTRTIKQSSEAGKICGMRSSPLGAYVLLWCKGMPSEIWSALIDQDEPVRVRQIELDFTSVEWLPREYGFPHASEAGMEDVTVKESGYTSLDDLPEELLSFSLSDARLGVLLIKGRKIQDTRPASPSWAPLVNGEFRVVSAAASRGFIFLGGSDGTLARWETSTGNVIAVETGCTRIEKIDVFDGGAKGGVKLALKSSSGTFAVLFVDESGKFTSSKVTWVSGYSKVGYVNDISWVKPPVQGGEGTMLMLHLREGGLCLLRFSNGDSNDGSNLERHCGTPISCSMLLPESLRNILCVLIQSGVLSSDLAKAVQYQDGQFSRDLESTLKSYLPGSGLQDVSSEDGTKDDESAIPTSPIGLHGEDMPQGSLAELLKSRASLGDDSSPGSPLYPANSRDSTDKAVFELGYRSSSQGGGRGDVSEALKSNLKSIKGSVKDIAVAGKEKVQKTLRQKDTNPQAPIQYSTSHIQSPTGSRRESWKSEEISYHTLQGAIKTASDIQVLSSFPVGPLEEAFMKAYEDTAESNKVYAIRMALCARIQWSNDEEQFWLDLNDHLSSMQSSDSEGNTPFPSSIVWQPQKHIDTLQEVSKWHSILSSGGVPNESESLVEKCMIELVSLGDIETAVSIQLASTPDISKRFYRDALCSLGMAYACASEALDMRENDLASSLFVQAARVIAINAATGGDPLLSIPLLYSTCKYKEVVDILQENGMWLCSACLAAKKLSGSDFKEPLHSLAHHMARKQGLVWQALGILIGSQQYEEAIDLMSQFQMYDRAHGLVRVLEEFNIDISKDTQMLVEQQYLGCIKRYMGRAQLDIDSF